MQKANNKMMEAIYNIADNASLPNLSSGVPPSIIVSQTNTSFKKS